VTFTRKAATEMRDPHPVVAAAGPADAGENRPSRWRELRDRTGDIA
jgi:hypothetical protein